MRELSLHIMDIVENSIAANSKIITIEVNEKKTIDLLEITVEDDGCGIKKEMLKNVTDPFVTSRKTRNVGLGLSLLKAACERCDGYLNIESEENKGTKVKATFKYNHIDRAPIGRMEDTIVSLIMSHNIEIIYLHKVDEKYFIFDTREIKKIVGDNISDTQVLNWMREYIKENIHDIGGGVW